MRYVNLVQRVLAVGLLVCVLPAGISARASEGTHHRAYAHDIHQRRHGTLAKRAEGHIQLFNRSAGSKWTFYDAQTGSAGSCGTMLTNTGYTVAMSAQQMSPEMCFKTIRLTAGGKSTAATITDTCESCPYNGLDLTQYLYGFFLGHIPSFQEGGVMQGEWEFGSDAPPAPPTKAPAPPTTTQKPVVPTTLSKSKKESSTHVSSSSSAASSSSGKTAASSASASSMSSVTTSVNYFSGPASALAVPTGTIDLDAAGTGQYGGNLHLFNQVIVGLGGLAVAARSI